ncbi:flavin-containing monooxygenase [Lichenihabitans psoromatis]|uniref:flavin-containing monooxygenase n=1 Tax=Lichenihabitans psoromatis TaxID=2528642 RepID=UPI001036163A|nr:NAD(P)/FAD-dependent oxidoreductase [Lichenihabitans psoromatis]
MSVEIVNTLVVGGGQAGLAMSEHLGKHEVPHIVLERHRIAERWRSERWDSLVANGPAWHDRFPGMVFPDADPDSFVSKDKVAEYFVDYARMINAPIRCGVEVRKVRRLTGSHGFEVETSHGLLQARNVVVATGPFQVPVRPTIVPETARVTQLHSNAYRNPGYLPEGAVLVVGAGSSGVQIADELLRAGKRVYLSVGRHDRLPRAYRGRDLSWWLGVLGKWDADAPGPNTEHVTIAVSGAGGGKTIDFRRLAASGMILVGRTEACRDDTLVFDGGLAKNLASGDVCYLSVLDEADAYVFSNGIDLPEEPGARTIDADPACVTDPIRELNLAEAGIASIIWATGYAMDYSWLDLDIFDANGQLKQRRGVSTEPGIYFLGLPWQSSRGSSFIWGVWHDAKYVADRIATKDTYLAYKPPEKRESISRPHIRVF